MRTRFDFWAMLEAPAFTLLVGLGAVLLYLYVTGALLILPAFELVRFMQVAPGGSVVLSHFFPGWLEWYSLLTLSQMEWVTHKGWVVLSICLLAFARIVAIGIRRRLESSRI